MYNVIYLGMLRLTNMEIAVFITWLKQSKVFNYEAKNGVFKYVAKTNQISK